MLRKSLGIKITLAVVLLVLFLTALWFSPLTNRIKNFFYTISSPIQKPLWQIGSEISAFFQAMVKIKDLKKENEALRTENVALLSRIALLEEQRTENEILRHALEVELNKGFKLAMARVVSKDISGDAILIDKGLKEGILKGFPVVTSEKALVGRVEEAYEKFSRVILISNKHSSFDAKIQEKNIPCVAKGKGNLHLFIDLLPKDKEIEGGNLVVTTSLGAIFPEGILVGKVKTVKKNDVEPFSQADITPAFDINALENVFIITDY